MNDNQFAYIKTLLLMNAFTQGIILGILLLE